MELHKDMFYAVISFIPDNLELRLCMKDDYIDRLSEDRSNYNEFLWQLYTRGFHTKKYYMSKQVTHKIGKPYIPDIYIKHLKYTRTFDPIIHKRLIAAGGAGVYEYIRQFGPRLTIDEYFSIPARYRVRLEMNDSYGITKEQCEERLSMKDPWDVLENIRVTKRIYHYHAITISEDHKCTLEFVKRHDCRTLLNGAKPWIILNDRLMKTPIGIYNSCLECDQPLTGDNKKHINTLIRCSMHTWLYAQHFNLRVPEFEEKMTKLLARKKANGTLDKYSLQYISYFDLQDLFIAAGPDAWNKCKSYYVTLLIRGTLKATPEVPLSIDLVARIFNELGSDAHDLIKDLTVLDNYYQNMTSADIRMLYTHCPYMIIPHKRTFDMEAIIHINNKFHHYAHLINYEYVKRYLELCNEGIIDPFDSIPKCPKLYFGKYLSEIEYDLHINKCRQDIHRQPQYYLQNGVAIADILKCFNSYSIMTEVEKKFIIDNADKILNEIKVNNLKENYVCCLMVLYDNKLLPDDLSGFKRSYLIRSIDHPHEYIELTTFDPVEYYKKFLAKKGLYLHERVVRGMNRHKIKEYAELIYNNGHCPEELTPIFDLYCHKLVVKE